MGYIHVKVNGALRKLMEDAGKAYEFDKEIADQGTEVATVIKELGLALDMVEAVFCNGKVINIYDRVGPGDRVALFPFGTPGPYRVFLGMLKENLRRDKLEKGQ